MWFVLGLTVLQAGSQEHCQGTGDGHPAPACHRALVTSAPLQSMHPRHHGTARREPAMGKHQVLLALTGHPLNRWQRPFVPSLSLGGMTQQWSFLSCSTSAFNIEAFSASCQVTRCIWPARQAHLQSMDGNGKPVACLKLKTQVEVRAVRFGHKDQARTGHIQTWDHAPS